jgi:hypothetical protein
MKGFGRLQGNFMLAIAAAGTSITYPPQPATPAQQRRIVAIQLYHQVKLLLELPRSDPAVYRDFTR